MKMEARKRETITREHIDIVDHTITDPRDEFQRLSVTQATGISDQSVKRICFGLSLARKGIKVHPCNNIPGKNMCKMINEKYSHIISRNECNKIRQEDNARENLIHAFTNNKNIKNIGKVLNFDKLVEEPDPKVQVKSDSQYLADAMMKLAEVTQTQNEIINLLLKRIK